MSQMISLWEILCSTTFTTHLLTFQVKIRFVQTKHCFLLKENTQQDIVQFIMKIFIVWLQSLNISDYFLTITNRKI